MGVRKWYTDKNGLNVQSINITIVILEIIGHSHRTAQKLKSSARAFQCSLSFLVTFSANIEN